MPRGAHQPRLAASDWRRADGIDYDLRQQLITAMLLADQLHAFVRGLHPAIKAEVLKARPKIVVDAVNTARIVESFLPHRARGVV